jgi:hypothetical protein
MLFKTTGGAFYRVKVFVTTPFDISLISLLSKFA